jgi:hypothetical protein
MPKGILIDEFHVTVVAPRGLPDAHYVAMHRTLAGLPFQRALRQAVQTVFRKYASLSKTRVRLSC